MELLESPSMEEFSDCETDEGQSTKTPKIILASNARKLIRMEKCTMLQTRRSQIVLDREIDKFKAQLEENRTLNKPQQTIHRRTYNVKPSKNDKDVSMQKINIMLDKVALSDAQKDGKIEFQRATRYVSSQNKPKKPKIKEKLHLHQKQPQSRENIEITLTMQQKQNDLKPKQTDIKIINDGPNIDIGIKMSGETEEIIHTQEVTPAVSKGTTHGHVKLLLKRLIHDILRHYWSRWKLYVLSAKSKREEEKKWREKINLFMKRANERGVAHTEKTSSMKEVKGSPTVVSEVKTHGKPISQPKTKSKDINQQNKEYKAMKEEINDSNQNALQITKQINNTLNPHLKCKAKLMRQFILNPKKEDKEVSPIVFPQSGIVVEMDRKHAERKDRMQALQEERRRIEEEKDQLAKERYEQQLLEAQMEKKRKLKEFQKKLRLEREQEERKRIKWQRMKEMEEKAVQHSRRHLLIKIGLEPWRRLVAQRRRNLTKAAEHNATRLSRCAIRRWRDFLQELENERMEVAEKHYTILLMRTSLRSWKCLVTKSHVEMQVAEDWYDYLLARNTLQHWQWYTITEGIHRQEMWQQAGIHYKKKILRKCIKYWMLFPQIIRLERSKEIRKNDWREKVQQVLPDFRPFISAE